MQVRRAPAVILGNSVRTLLTWEQSGHIWTWGFEGDVIFGLMPWPGRHAGALQDRRQFLLAWAEGGTIHLTGALATAGGMRRRLRDGTLLRHLALTGGSQAFEVPISAGRRGGRCCFSRRLAGTWLPAIVYEPGYDSVQPRPFLP
jgi:hypothetical protein